jgi:hypothetical protein
MNLWVTASASNAGSVSVGVMAASNAVPNRVHRRLILRDYGKPIYKSSSRASFLAALEGCIEGHESLRNELALLLLAFLRGGPTYLLR